MRGVHYSACSLCYKKIAQFHQKCSLMRDCSLFRRLLLPEYTVYNVAILFFSFNWLHCTIFINKYDHSHIDINDCRVHSETTQTINWLSASSNPECSEAALENDFFTFMY